ncbi:hypothetical protein L9F63_013929, partial [Diploptera punctata]
IFPDIQEQILNQGSMQLVVADLPGISQSTVPPVIRKVSTSIAELKLQFITFPNGDELDSSMARMLESVNLIKTS